MSLALVAATGTAGIEGQFPELPPGSFEEVERTILLFALLSAAGPFVRAGGVSTPIHLASRPFTDQSAIRATIAKAPRTPA